MRLIRPGWLAHRGDKKDFEIYSCHVSADGSRLVTAGGDGFVRVWSTEAVYNAEDPSFTKPRQLASMSYHAGTIHAVRFSGNGQYLASGADDKLVIIYKLDPKAVLQESTFGSNDAPQMEAWKVYRRLIGHENDVQDLGWSHDSSILVSVGLDSKVVVWSGYTFEKLKTLSAHHSHVKGITFDPANKFFATASDDRTIRIWEFTPPGPTSTSHDQVNNFVLHQIISEPFAASPLTTYFRRCSWSPDGQHIAGANAVNGPVSAAVIIERGTWDTQINLIGHEGPNEVCAFSPRLFTFTKPEDRAPDAAGTHTVIACGGQDKALSIWITTRPRPLAIVHDLTAKPITDLTFTPDGKTLFVASLDGHMVTMVFNSDELGYEMKPEENDKALAKFGSGRRGAGLIEGPDALLLEEKSKEGEMKGAEGRMGALMGHGESQPLVNGNAEPALSNGVQKDQTEADARPKPAVNGSEKPKEDANAAKLEALKNRVQRTKDGKKRIAPLLVSGDGESSLPRPQLMNATSGAQAVSDQPQQILDLSKPYDGLPPGGLAAMLLGTKRKFAAVDGQEDEDPEKKLNRKDGAVPIVTNTPTGLVPAKGAPPKQGQEQTPDFIRPATANPSLSVSQVRLAVPKVRTHIVRSHLGETTKDSAQTAVLEAQNQTLQAATPQRPDHEPCRITVTRRGQPIFQDYLPRNVLLVTGNTEYWAAACEDGAIYAWTPAGRRIFNAVILESQPVMLESQNQYLLCITAVGMCSVWDMHTLTSPHPPVSLAPILDIAIHSMLDRVTRGPAVTGARLNSEGRIIVTLTNGEGYAYNPSLYHWQRLSELWWLVGSQYWNTTDSSVGNLSSNSTLDSEAKNTTSAGVIPFLERSTTTTALARGRGRMLTRIVNDLLNREGYEGFESSVSIGHLENRVAAAMMLGAKDDFRVYLYMYAKRIGAEGLRGKVEELLRGVMGDIEGSGVQQVDGEGESDGHRPEHKDRWWGNGTGKLVGWERQELMKSVVLLLGKNRDLQRVVVPYARILGITEEQQLADGDALVT